MNFPSTFMGHYVLLLQLAFLAILSFDTGMKKKKSQLPGHLNYKKSQSRIFLDSFLDCCRVPWQQKERTQR